MQVINDFFFRLTNNAGQHADNHKQFYIFAYFLRIINDLWAFCG